MVKYRNLDLKIKSNDWSNSNIEKFLLDSYRILVCVENEEL